MNKLKPLIFVALLLGAMTVIYLPLFTPPVEFVGDDVSYVTSNTLLQEPLTLELMSRLLFAPYNTEYIPLLFISLRGDVELWGLNPVGFRLTNLFLFFLLGIAIYSLCVRITPRDEGSAGGGLHLAAFSACALVLLHPLNVESIAVAVHRKELLYALFTVLAVRQFADERRSLRNTLSTALFVLFAQLSKGSAFVVPMILLVYEIFFRRLAEGKQLRFMKLGISFAASWGIFLYQLKQAFQLVLSQESITLSPGAHMGGIVKAFAFSAQHILFPLGLSFEYSLKWPGSFEADFAVLAPIILILVIGALVYARNARGLFYILATLVAYFPYANAIRLRHGYGEYIVHYDHYLLVPLALAALPIAFLLSRVKQHHYQKAVWTLVIATCTVFAVQDFHSSGYWKTRETLYRRSIESAPAMGRPYFFLGNAYLDEGRYAQAIDTLEGGLRVDPANIDLLLPLSDAYALSGDYSSALPLLERYHKFRPDNEKALQNLALTCIMLERYDDAQRYLKKWLAISPESPQAHEVMELLQEKTGKGIR